MSQQQQNRHPQPFHGFQTLSQTPQNAAYYVFNEKLVAFADTINFLAKFSDLMLVEFGDKMLYIEAITPTKSAYACATFQESSIADWSYGDFEDILDKRIQLSAKQLVGALRHVTKHDTMQFFIFGASCEKVAIEYTNSRDIKRSYSLQAREMSINYNKSDVDPTLYSNKIVCSTQFFKILFTQLLDTDEMCLQFFPDRSVITKYITEGQEATSSTLHSMQASDTYETYQITVPMSMTLSVRELKVSLKLISVHSYMASIYFDLSGKPLLITFDDEEKDERCKVVLSIADARELTEEEEQPESATTQSGIANDSRRSSQSHTGFTQASSRHQHQQHRQEEEESEAASEEPPKKQRRKSKPFSFEDDDDDENEIPQQHSNNFNPASSGSSSNQSHVPQENNSSSESTSGNRNTPQNPGNNNSNDSFNYGSFPQQDFDDIQEPAAAIVPSPSEIPPPPQQKARNSISPTCLGLRMLGIEDQISDPEAEDVCEIYDLPATNPSDNLFILSQSQYPT